MTIQPTIDREALGLALRAEYELGEPLGRGGYGTVFSGRAKHLDRPVAIKVQRLPSTEDEQERLLRVARFEREARLCEALDHPHIVRLLGKGQFADHLVLVFELVAGQTLGEYLARSGPMNVGEAIPLLGQVLDALQQAHSRGIVHRDLKPDNLMVLSDGTARHIKVLDFGVGAFTAGVAERGPTLTRSHEVLGTPCYSAPEQLRGEPATARSDIYSWGLIFLECLTGQRAMDGTVAQVFHRQLSAAEVELPSLLATHALGVLLRRALAKDSRQRAPHAGRLRTELQRTTVSDLVGSFGGALSRAMPTLAVQAPGLSGELRQATAICCSLGIVSLLPGPANIELLDAIQRDQLRSCGDVARRFGGQVVGTLANRILVVFGVPEASDSDARRAARAALDLGSTLESRRSLLASQRGIGLELRIGMHTGPIIVNEYGELSGPALNEAARLESWATPGTTLVSSASYRVLQRQLRFEPAPRSSAESHGAPLYTLISEGPADAYGSLDDERRSDFVGRELELSRLLEHWGEAQRGAGRVVLLRGEAGVGKSRLSGELCRRARDAGNIVLSAQCAPEYSHTSLYPFRKLVQHRLVSAGTEGLAQHLVEELQSSGLEPREALPGLCQWLGLSPPEGYPALHLSPERQRELLLETLAAWCCSAGGSTALVLVLEDLHWSDPTTLELLARIERRSHTHRALVVATSRAEPSGLAEVRDVIELTGLDDAATRRLVSSLLGDVPLRGADIADIVRRTDGIPLFIEELTRSLLETRDDTDATPQSLRTPVPPSLRDLLHGRLDRLGHAKETAQTAAAIGREFDVELLKLVSLRGPEALLADLDTLVEAGVAQQHLHAGAGHYSFRHALTREVASDSMLSPQRTAVHRSIALELEGRSARGLPVEPERLAHHFATAALHEPAVRYGLTAAARAAGAAAYVEALSHYQQVSSSVAQLAEGEQRSGYEIDVHNARGATLIACRGFALPEVVETFTRARELSRRVQTTPTRASTTLNGLWTFHNARAEFGEAARLARELIELGEREGSTEFLLIGHAAACQTDTVTGDFAAALEHAAVCGRVYDPEVHAELGVRYGIDPGLTALSFAAMANVLIGRVSLARSQVSSALAAAERTQSPVSQANMLGQAAGVELFLGSCGPRPNAALGQCTRYARAGLELATRFGLGHAFAYNAFLAAAADVDTDPEGQALLEQSLPLWEAAGVRASASWRSSYIAQARRARGNFAGAVEIAAFAVKHCEETGEGYGLSEAHRILGLNLGDRLNPDRDLERAAIAHRKAVSTAREQGAHWLELRAAYSFAEQIRSEEARAAVGEALGWFSDNGETDTELVAACRTLYHL